MGTTMEKPLGEMSLKALIECGAQEIRKYHRREPSNDGYCLEILRRAVVLNDHEAWAALQTLLHESVRLWFTRHPSREVALRYEPVERNYIDDTFRRFWQAINAQDSAFSSVAGAMSYLHLCLNAAIMDVLRAYARPREMPIPDAGSPGEPLVEDAYDEGELWEAVKSLLPDGREQHLAFLLFHCNLKPREIMRYCPGAFRDETEIYRMKRNILDRILRNREKLRWRLDDSPEG